jgi:hypothetical protein
VLEVLGARIWIVELIQYNITSRWNRLITGFGGRAAILRAGLVRFADVITPITALITPIPPHDRNETDDYNNPEC